MGVFFERAQTLKYEMQKKRTGQPCMRQSRPVRDVALINECIGCG